MLFWQILSGLLFGFTATRANNRFVAVESLTAFRARGLKTLIVRISARFAVIACTSMTFYANISLVASFANFCFALKRFRGQNSDSIIDSV